MRCRFTGHAIRHAEPPPRVAISWRRFTHTVLEPSNKHRAPFQGAAVVSVITGSNIDPKLLPRLVN